MYQTLSSLHGHEYIPETQGNSCNIRDPSKKCNTYGCIRCQPLCKKCKTYHPSLQYNVQNLNFMFSRESHPSTEYQNYLYHPFEPNTDMPVRGSTNVRGSTTIRGHPPKGELCDNDDCSLCVPTCKQCGKLEKNHSYKDY